MNRRNETLPSKDLSSLRYRSLLGSGDIQVEWDVPSSVREPRSSKDSKPRANEA